MIWRDVWEESPSVVILSEDDVQGDVIPDVALFLLGEPAAEIVVSDPDGGRYRLTLPEDIPRETGLYFGFDLTVESMHEETD